MNDCTDNRKDSRYIAFVGGEMFIKNGKDIKHFSLECQLDELIERKHFLVIWTQIEYLELIRFLVQDYCFQTNVDHGLYEWSMFKIRRHQAELSQRILLIKDGVFLWL